MWLRDCTAVYKSDLASYCNCIFWFFVQRTDTFTKAQLNLFHVGASIWFFSLFYFSFFISDCCISFTTNISLCLSLCVFNEPYWLPLMVVAICVCVCVCVWLHLYHHAATANRFMISIFISRGQYQFFSQFGPPFTRSLRVKNSIGNCNLKKINSFTYR